MISRVRAGQRKRCTRQFTRHLLAKLQPLWWPRTVQQGKQERYLARASFYATEWFVRNRCVSVVLTHEQGYSYTASDVQKMLPDEYILLTSGF
jgi:hypothetical protein